MIIKQLATQKKLEQIMQYDNIIGGQDSKLLWKLCAGVGNLLKI